MALSADIETELSDIASLPQAEEIRDMLGGLSNLKAARENGSWNGAMNRAGSLMIASDTIEEASKLAEAYARAAHKLGATQDAKVTTLEWKDVFVPAAGDTEDAAMFTNIRALFNEKALGGALIVRAPYDGPAGKSALDAKSANYSAQAELMYQMDKDPAFDRAFENLYKQGKSMHDIEQEMGGKNFVEKDKPLVIVIGEKSRMNAMYAEDPTPWNMRFTHRIGVEQPKTTFGKYW